MQSGSLSNSKGELQFLYIFFLQQPCVEFLSLLFFFFFFFYSIYNLSTKFLFYLCQTIIKIAGA